MRLLSTLFFICLSAYGFGQLGFKNYAGARGLGLAGIGSTLQGIEGQYTNPSSLAYVDGMSVNISSERRFESIALYQMGLSLGYLLNEPSAIGIHAQRISLETFSNTKLGFTYARKLYANFSIGAQFTYQQISIDLHGSKSIANASFGVQGAITKELTAGVSVLNVIPVKLLEGEEQPTVFIAGLRYELSEYVLVMAELEKDIDFPVNVKVGFEYVPMPMLAIRGGINSNPAAYHFGIGMLLSNKAWINFATAYDQNLGFSPALGITVR